MATAEPTTQVRCGTRALKNARYLREHAPQLLLPDEDADGLGTGLSEPVLDRLHRLGPDSPEVRSNAPLAEFLREHPVPAPSSSRRGPLFTGTLHFAQVTFHAGGQSFVMPSADMQTIVQYAQRAIPPILEYARQYGPTQATVSPNIITYSVDLTHPSYRDKDVQTWVNDIATRNHLPHTDAVVIVSPQGLTAPNVDSNAGYHGFANLAYTIFGVFSTNLALQDPHDVYAMVVSHEIAELIVDPNIDQANPEVCDPCDLNCGAQNLNRVYFDAQNKYVQTVPALPPAFAYSYYICAVVKPAGAAGCPAPHTDCVYPPPAA